MKMMDRMVQKDLAEGLNTLALVLPESFSGDWVKLELNTNSGDSLIQSLEIAPVKD